MASARGRSLSTWLLPVWLLASSPASAQIEAEFKDEFDAQASTEEKAPAEPEGAPASPAEPPEQRRLRVANTWFGPSGGLRVVDAGSGLPGTFRLQLGLEFFSTSDFMLAGDENDYSGATLSLSWTVADFLELFGSMASHANFNTMESPALLQVLGDAWLGAKAFHSVEPFLTLGGDFRLVVLNTVGDIGPVFEAISFGFRGNLSTDLRELEEPVPLIMRLSLDYLFDNSANLIDGVERARYDRLGPDRLAFADEDRHLIRRVERFALGINRTDSFAIALGFEAPLRADRDFFIHPLLEWTLGIPVNRQGYSCLLVPTAAGPGDPDGCLDIEGFAAMPSTLTLGARVFPPVPGLSFLLGADIGLSGTSTFVRELAANKPYLLLLALSYGVDARERVTGEVREVEVVREVVKAPPPKPRVSGLVVDSGTGAGIPDAAVRYPDRELTAQLTDAQGRFTSYELEPGEARFEISHPDYEGRLCVITIPAEPPAAPKPPAAAPGAPPGATPAPPVAPEAGAPAPAPDAAAPGAPPAAPGSEGANPYTPESPELNPYFRPSAAGGTSAPSTGLLLELRCELVAKPRAGSVRGTVLSDKSAPIAGAQVELTGPSSHNVVSDSAGEFTVPSLGVGNYGVRVDAEGYLIGFVSIDVKPGEQATPRVTLAPKPKQAQVELTKQEVRIRKEIFFKTNSAEISEKSSGLLNEIADVMLRNPQVREVEVQGHTDNTGTPEANQLLSQQRAEAVRAALIAAGVAEARLSAKGYGDSRPLVPNITDRNRARNRRVQFIIRQQE